MPTFEKPSVADLRHAADQLGMNPSMMYLNTVQDILGPLVAAYAALDAVPDEKPAVKYPRDGGWRPAPDENKLGAWYMKTSIKGKPGGKLAGRRVALKDNVCLAGVPMMVGAAFLEGSVPDIDATIVNRILDEGGEIAGKAVCEYYCVSGGSHTSSTGPVQNPRKHGYTTGGSSSGSAALVAAGEVPMAIGGDQAGSIRIPASYCGIVGMKPTFGLVPYTGIGPLEITIDTAGPMTANVADNALLLEVIAGPDGLDSRQHQVPRVDKYTEALRQGVKGLRIGVLKEGFGHPNAEPDVDAKVRAAAERFKIARRDCRGRVGAGASDARISGVGGDPRRRRLRHAPGDERLRPRLRGALSAERDPGGDEMARPRRRIRRHAEDRHDLLEIHARPLRRALLRQGAEPAAAAARGL